jgi:hypothetical protein
MKYLVKDLMADWLGPLEKTPTADTFSNRLEAIEEISEHGDYSFWLNLVRQAFGLSNSLRDDEFVLKFKKQDGTFPLTNNTELVTALAAATICFELEHEGDSDFSHWLSLAIVNMHFLRSESYAQKIPLHSYAIENLENKSRETRLFDISLVHNQLEELSEEDVDDEAEVNPTNKAMVSLLKLNLKLYEETNILWWLFGERSTLSGKTFDQLDGNELCLNAAKELFNLTTAPRILESYKEFLKKVLGRRSTDKTTLLDVVRSASPTGDKGVDLPNWTPTEFTPVLDAVKVNSELPGSDWNSAFGKYSNNSNAKEEVSLLDVSMQLYRELVFHRLSNND